MALRSHHGLETEIVRTEAELLETFASAFSQNTWVGLEAEKFGLRPGGVPLRYGNAGDIPGILTELADRFGWTPERETDDGPVLALSRTDGAISLEPGSQLELSTAPREDIHAIVADVERHKDELSQLETARGIRWLGLGFHPLASVSDLDWVPKSRYPIMRAYLPTRGQHGLDMMLRTATVQANFDFSDERDAMEKLRVGLALSPLVAGLFACSPLVEGRRTGEVSHRARVWLDVDNDRAGLLPFAWSADAGIADYVRWALSVPMFVLVRGADVYRMTHHTFATFMARGEGPFRATRADWERHLNTLFPDVRLKKTLEVRSADSVPSQWSYALPALWTAVLYHRPTRDAVASLLLPFGFDAWNRARTDVGLQGLATTLRAPGSTADVTLGSLAVKVLDLAAAGLRARNRRDGTGRDESVYLEPLRELAAAGLTVGDALLEGWQPDAQGALDDLCERARY